MGVLNGEMAWIELIFTCPYPGRRQKIKLNLLFSYFLVVPEKVLWRPFKYEKCQLKDVWSIQREGFRLTFISGICILQYKKPLIHRNEESKSTALPQI